MKDHETREMINELREVALKYHGHQCLRELISRVVHKYQTPPPESLTKRFVFEADDDPEYYMIVDVKSFSYSKRLSNQKVCLSIHGVVRRAGVESRFSLEKTKSFQHRLRFYNSTIWDGSDPRKVALHTKQALLDFVDRHSDVPESFRYDLRCCILTHHLQKDSQ